MLAALGLLAFAATPTAAAPTAQPAPASKPAIAAPAAVSPVAVTVKPVAVTPAAGADLNDCLSCHHPLLDGRTAHLPRKDGDCIACHQPAAAGVPGKCLSPKAAAWQLTDAQPALCARCHDTTASTPHAKAQDASARQSPMLVFGVGPMHPVIKSKGCTACHDPHASNSPSLTKTWPVEALCATCHAKYDDAKFIHTAVDNGDCLGCHSPHGSEFKPLLLAKREQLCAGCHKAAVLMPGSVKHPPAVAGKCLTCHDPHESDEPAQLVKPVNELCISCHKAQANPAHAGGAHAPSDGGVSKSTAVPLLCIRCHDPHSSDHPSLLRDGVGKP